MNDVLKRKNYVLVCDTVKQNCPELYTELENVLKQRYSEGQFEIISLAKYHELSGPEQNKLFNRLRFVFFHTDTGVSYLLTDAFERGVPIILVRGDDISDDWSSILQRCGVGENIDRECAKRMIYPVDEVTDIRGALRWVNDYYHPLLQTTMNRLERSLGRLVRARQQPHQG